MLNLPLFDKVMKLIELEPERWEQSTWAYKAECGTAFCFAGHVVNLTMPEDAYFPFSEFDRETARVVIDGAMNSISTVAMRELGISAGEAVALFNGGNTMTDIRRIRDFLVEKYETI